MPEDKERVINNNPVEVTPAAPRIQYRFLRFSMHGHTNHYAYTLYGSEPLQGAQLAEANYTDGEIASVSIKYSTKEDLLDRYNKAVKSRRRGFRFGGHGPALYPSNDAVCFVPNGNGFDVLDDEETYLGKQVGTLKVGERFTHEAIPYVLEISNNEAQTTFRRINPSDYSAWEFSIPNQAPVDGPEEIPISFKGRNFKF